MQPEAQHQERADGFRCWTPIEALIGHEAEDLFGDLPILADRAVSFQHRHNRLERITMDPGDTLDFLHARGRVLEIDIAGIVPIGACAIDIGLRNQPFDRAHARCEVGMLPQPTRFLTGEGERNAQHVHFPCGVEAAPPLAPLHIPVPD